MNPVFPCGDTIRDLVAHCQQAMWNGTTVLFALRVLGTQTSPTDQVIWFSWQLVTLYLQPFVVRCSSIHLYRQAMKPFRAASSSIVTMLRVPIGLMFNGKNTKFLTKFLTKFDRICDHTVLYVAFFCVKSSWSDAIHVTTWFVITDDAQLSINPNVIIVPDEIVSIEMKIL